MTTTERPEAFRASTHILAIVSLIFAILGLLPILPVVGSIAAIVTGILARREIRARPDQHSGEGTASAGIILGWIGLFIWVVGGCLIIAALIPFQFYVTPGSGPVMTAVPVMP